MLTSNVRSFDSKEKKQRQKNECRVLLAIDPPSPEVIPDKDDIEEVTLQSLDLFSQDCFP